MGHVLVIGVGSDLRRDDGVGRHVAERVEALALRDTEVLVTTQLVPELVEQIAGSDRVVFVDASVAIVGVEVSEIAVVGQLAGSRDSHLLTPGALLAVTAPLGLSCPAAFLVEIAAHDLALGEGLSEETASLVDHAVAEVLALVRAGEHDAGTEAPIAGVR